MFILTENYTWLIFLLCTANITALSAGKYLKPILCVLYFVSYSFVAFVVFSANPILQHTIACCNVIIYTEMMQSNQLKLQN